MKRIVVVGEYGIRSLGDEAMLHAIGAGLARRLGDVDILPLGRLVAVCFDGETQETFNERMAARVLESVNSLADHAGMPVGSQVTPMTAVDPYQAIRDADLLVLGGGCLFHDVNISLFFGPMTVFTGLVAMARAFGVPVYVLGATFGPFHHAWGRDIAAWALRQCAAVTVRDRASLEFARSVGVDAELLPDPAVALRPNGRGELGGDYLVVAPRHWDGFVDWAPELGAALDEIARRTGLTPVLVPHCVYEREAQDDDRLVCRALAGVMGTEPLVLEGPASLVPENVMGLYANVPAAITIRLHGAVFAATAGTPHLALAYQPKVEGFCEWSGAPWVPVDAGKDEIVEAFMGLWDRRADERLRLAGAIEAMRRKLPRYWEIAAEVLDGR